MTEIQEFKQNLTAIRDKLEPMLKGDTDKFIQIAANYVEQNQHLLKKNRASLYDSIIKAAQQGLYIDGLEAALVPFKDDVKFMSMYKGLLKQVRNSGELASINCGVVYEKDVFEYYVDEKGEHLKHVPDFKAGKERGKPINVYAIARIKEDHPPYIEVMTEEDIQNCKKSSRAGNESPWNGPFADEMRKKTIIRRISKRLPSSTDLNASMHNDDEWFEQPEEPETPPSEPETSQRLRDAITQKTEQQPSATPAPTPTQEPPQKGEMVEGVIQEIKTYEVKKDNKPTPLYSCKVADVQYLTFSADMNKVIADAFAKKVPVTVIFKKSVSTSNKSYNEILDIIRQPVKEEDVPI